MKWIGLPPLPFNLRVIARKFFSLDQEDQFQSKNWTPSWMDRPSFNEDGFAIEWRSPLVSMCAVARLIGRYHPCKIRSIKMDLDSEEDPWKKINNVPWIQSFDLGKTDVAGRLIF